MKKKVSKILETSIARFSSSPSFFFFKRSKVKYLSNLLIIHQKRKLPENSGASLRKLQKSYNEKNVVFGAANYSKNFQILWFFRSGDFNLKFLAIFSKSISTLQVILSFMKFFCSSNFHKKNFSRKVEKLNIPAIHKGRPLKVANMSVTF